jgi:hypothetical protein
MPEHMKQPCANCGKECIVYGIQYKKIYCSKECETNGKYSKRFIDSRMWEETSKNDKD